jgi:galactokinase
MGKIGQYAENRYFGKPCGLLDQMTAAAGGFVKMDFSDPQNPVVERIDCDLSKSGYTICLTDTKGDHSDLTADYAAIPSEMKAVANLLGSDTLRDTTKEAVTAQSAYIRRICGDRAFLRAMHFFDENIRVDIAEKALKEDCFPEFLETIKASGDSSYRFLQNIYSVKNTAAEAVAIGLYMSEQLLGVHGVSRVHGGGFAGTIQSYVPDNLLESYTAAMEAVFGTGCCHKLTVRKYGGVRVDFNR